MSVAAKDTSRPTYQFRTSDGPVTQEIIDGWELEASRRALMNLRTLLHGQPMLDLIADQMQEADEYYKSVFADSGDEFKPCRVDIALEGLTASAFLGWFMSMMMLDPEAQAFTRVYPAHPEHYAMVQEPQAIIEVIGGRIARVFMDIVELEELPSVVTDAADPSFTTKVGFNLRLEDGTRFGYLLDEFRDTEAGGDIRLTVFFPASAPDLFVEGHTQHFCVEFGHWVRQAMAEIGQA